MSDLHVELRNREEKGYKGKKKKRGGKKGKWESKPGENNCSKSLVASKRDSSKFLCYSIILYNVLKLASKEKLLEFVDFKR